MLTISSIDKTKQPEVVALARALSATADKTMIAEITGKILTAGFFIWGSKRTLKFLQELSDAPATIREHENGDHYMFIAPGTVNNPTFPA